MTLLHYLVLAAVLFVLGLVTLATRRNAIGVLLGIELILNAANLNLVAFSRHGIGGVEGQVFTVFVIALAAAETVVALAIVLAIFHHYRTVEVDRVSQMKN
ncbi:MAG: NADH-quinone oxidoreductase subunit NuoK [Deltaproteobacteria bacterium]|nr:NADH-quinone oxidoreductase subunit NuoK [Deltaproteobacteria bacterium]